ncbi:MAG TPA: thiamine pyrophosphate-binding protein [Dehalococcoidia bacterium]|nr:thiamine pyrophosphate-binding protein [Dehalococcoidia bacterium]
MNVTAELGIAHILQTEGVEFVSTFPTNGVNNALGPEGVRLLMMRDDRYAIAVADAYSRLNNGNKIGVATVMGGVNSAGLQVAYAGLAQAFEDGSPMLVLTDGVPTGSTQNAHFDPIEALRHVTKWAARIDTPAATPQFMRRAFTLLRSGRPGPVLLAIPRNMGEYDEDAHPYVPVKGWRSAPDPLDVTAAADILRNARKPLIFAGEGVLYADASQELLEFAELAQAPVLTTLKGKGAFPEQHPLSIGVRGGPASTFLDECDVLFAVGSSLSPGRFSHAVPNPAEKQVVQCVVDEWDLNKMLPTDHAVIGDAKFTLAALCEELRSGGGGDRDPALAARIESEKAEFDAEYGEHLASADQPINPYRVYAGLQEVLDPENSFVTHESGNTRDQLSTAYRTTIPRGFLGWGNVSTLGFSFGAVVAAKLAFPDRQCIAVSGDAGVGYMLGNLEAAVRNELGITVIHISNGGFGGYGPGFWGGGHDPYTHEVLDSDTIDMSKAVANLGYHSERIDDPADVESALRRALERNAEGQPAYLEFICSQFPVYGSWVTDPSAPR